MTDHQETQESDDCHSDGYYMAMERIDLELLGRDPRYRDPHHHNWDLFSLPCSMEERRSSIVNIICCSMMRSSAILAHAILGTRDPDAEVDTADRWHAPRDWRLPINRLLSAILYKTPIHYIDSQDRIWFSCVRGDELIPGYQVFLKDILLMMDFAAVADALMPPAVASGETKRR